MCDIRDKGAAFMDWLKKQVTLQNIVMTATLIITLILNTNLWIRKQTQADIDLTRRVAALELQIENHEARMRMTERFQDQLDMFMAKDFPRRTELEPRLKSIDDRITELNELLKRLLLPITRGIK